MPDSLTQQFLLMTSITLLFLAFQVLFAALEGKKHQRQAILIFMVFWIVGTICFSKYLEVREYALIEKIERRLEAKAKE